MSDYAYVGQVIPVAWDSNIVAGVVDWLPCDGSVHQISQFQQLFNTIGNRYGGNGTTTFAVPDLRMRITVGTTQNYPLGQQGGQGDVALTARDVMGHSHAFLATNDIGYNSDPDITQAVGQLGGTDASKVNIFAPYDPAKQTTLDPVNAITRDSAARGGGVYGHNNMQPALGISFIICCNGPPP